MQGPKLHARDHQPVESQTVSLPSPSGEICHHTPVEFTHEQGLEFAQLSSVERLDFQCFPSSQCTTSSQSHPGFFYTFILVVFCQEKMLLQGVGLEEYQRYGMASLSSSQLSDLAGNAFSANVCSAFLVAALTSWHHA